ncbi:hypothetical protein LTR04_000797 [Oleoguttula sp. CCFEE 6159]|nr:hypothetical protein LTR04_000797 [Oleoguttula sp. CCFEE 6159]
MADIVVLQVLEYLNKKGYSRTEAMLRRESAHVNADGQPINNRAEDSGLTRYTRAFEVTHTWIDDNLELYKAELKRLQWPLFVYSFFNFVADFYPTDSAKFFGTYRDLFSREHEEDLRALRNLSLPEHLESNHVAKLYRSNKHRLTLSNMAFHNLIQFLESKDKEGGAVVISIIQSFMNIVTVDRAVAGSEYSLSALLNKGSSEDDIPAEDEGIPGHNPGSANTDVNAPPVLTKLALGPLPMEPDLMEDVRAQLQEEDERKPPTRGQPSLLENFELQIKQEPTEDAPSRDSLPLPPSVARDVVMEVQKVKENRDRFKIEGRTGGVGPGVSVTMFTFHNTFDSINCLEFSGDNKLVAAGMAESYIRVWSLEGKPLPFVLPPGPGDPSPTASSSRRLIGHSGPVYALSFSPSIATEDPTGPQANARCLLSCSADKSIRLWSLDTWTCLVVYRGHDAPVWDITWGPFGHYFLTGGQDRTARLWSSDHISALRIFAGHDNDVDCVVFHPNNAYVFTGSCDKTVRMWDINRGTAVRMFTGHTSNITSLACAPNGKILASADDAGAIILWDLASGRRMKRMRGHSKGGIWSLSFSVESTVLVSGGADGTVRVWDVLQTTSDSTASGKVIAEGGSGAKIDGTGGATGPSAAGVTGASAGKKSKGKDVVVSADQISAFPTKKSPVYKVAFTGMNLVLAGGAYMP